MVVGEAYAGWVTSYGYAVAYVGEAERALLPIVVRLSLVGHTLVRAGWLVHELCPDIHIRRGRGCKPARDRAGSARDHPPKSRADF